MTIYDWFKLLGGVGLFLFGMKMMSEGLSNAAGDKLRGILEKVTGNRVMAVLLGILVTVLIQSSSATDMMVIGFVNSGLMGLGQAIAVIMGANIGTTVTAQITAFNLTDYTPLILFIGAVIYMFMKKPRIRHIGAIIMGFGMLFTGIWLIKQAILPLSQETWFINALDTLQNPALAVVFGILFTALLQSSSSSVVIFQTFAVQGLLDYGPAVYLLIGGATGQGKSVFLHSLICSLVQDHSPKEVEFVLMDPKRVEFSVYTKLPHLHAHIVYDTGNGTAMMKHIESVMDGRFSLFAEKGCGNITEYNIATEGDGLPHTIVVIDEFSDFMCNDECGVFESTVSRIAALGRAAGIHLVMATSRPAAKVVTGALKANIPGRLSFRVAAKVDSRTLFGEVGAEALPRPGSALLKTSNGAVIHVQVPLIRDTEIKEIVDSVLARYSEGEPEEKSETDCDEALFEHAVELARTTGRASLSLFQRQLGIGYNAAVRLMDRLEKLPKFKNIRTRGLNSGMENGIMSPSTGV